MSWEFWGAVIGRVTFFVMPLHPEFYTEVRRLVEGVYTVVTCVGTVDVQS
jgi:hypothetical protein